MNNLLGMNLTDEQKKWIKDLSSLFYSPSKIAIITGIDKDVMKNGMMDTDSEIYKCYYSGQFESEAKLRKSILKLATAGSSPGQTIAIKMLDECRREETR